MPAPLTAEQIACFRKRVCEIAERQFVERGIDRVSMRSLAEGLNCSATALYSYFENKEEIFAAARTNALNRLSERLEIAFASTDDPWRRSRAVGDAYIDFANAEPEAYRLVFALAQPEKQRWPDLAAAEDRAAQNTWRYVDEMVSAGLLVGDPKVLAHVFWAGMHGLIVLQMAGKLGPDRPPFEILRHEMMRLITRGATPNPSPQNQPDVSL
ncbi:MAG: TetR/AcrR family transcriptional regulator [Spongiibacteraceae bacterium]